VKNIFRGILIFQLIIEKSGRVGDIGAFASYMHRVTLYADIHTEVLPVLVNGRGKQKKY
jgi:hypothetical protein